MGHWRDIGATERTSPASRKSTISHESHSSSALFGEHQRTFIHAIDAFAVMTAGGSTSQNSAIFL